MRSRIRFYNRQGRPLDEIDATTTRSWLLNEVGECTFVIGKRNQKLLKYLVEFGNFVLVTNEHTNPWIGVIDLPRVWIRRGPRVTAYSAEHMLKKRYDQVNDPVTNLLKLPVTLQGMAGELFTQIVNLANVPEDTVLEAARVYMDGVTRQETLKSDYLTHVKNISLRTGQDFDVRHSLSSSNQLSLQANWYSRKGQNRGVALEEGVNIRLNDEVMIEQGQIINSVIAVGAGSVDSSRLAAFAKSDASIRLYGLREGVVTYSTVTELPTLQNNADVFVRQNAYPRLTARITCTEQGIFNQMETGDVVPLVLHTAGFLTSNVLGLRTTTRILGLQAFDKGGTLDVLVDEFTEGD